MKKTALYLVALVGLVGLLGVASMFTGSRPPVHATTTCPNGEASCLSGWAWSDNVGWISFNSSDSGAASSYSYDVSIDSSGNLGGYAWSPNLGWISFNSSDLSVAPVCSGTAQANVNKTTGTVTGWARVISEEGRGTNDGWDGCIELSGTNHPTVGQTGFTMTSAGTSTAGLAYGIDSTKSTYGKITGYAWGSTVLGWLSFSPQTTTGSYPPPPCVTGTPNCPPGTNSSSFTFLVGSNGSSYGPSTTVTADSNNQATVYINWNPSNVSNVKITNQDWGDVNNQEVVGATKSPSGYSFSATSPNYDTVVIGNVTATTKLKWYLSYVKSDLNSETASTTVILYPKSSIVTNQNNCTQPAHTNICGDITNTTNPATVYATSSDPSCVNAGNSCKFYCQEGYVLRNNSCTKSTLIEQ
jgi:hypothetical protein